MNAADMLSRRRLYRIDVTRHAVLGGLVATRWYYQDRLDVIARSVVPVVAPGARLVEAGVSVYGLLDLLLIHPEWDPVAPAVAAPEFRVMGEPELDSLAAAVSSRVSISEHIE